MRGRDLVRCGELVLRSPRIPRWVKALAVIALLPIPGPLDEALGLIALAMVAIFYRSILIESWAMARRERIERSASRSSGEPSTN